MSVRIGEPDCEDYISLLKLLLPADAFVPAPRKLLFVPLYLLGILAGYLGIRYSESSLIWLACSFLIGNSLACLAFLSHELSHGSILRAGRVRYFTEVVLWALNCIPATLWHRVHNQTHHRYTNMYSDPDRMFLSSESSIGRSIYCRVFYPGRHTKRWVTLAPFHFVPYILRNTVAAFWSDHSKPPIVPFKPEYSSWQRILIVLEILAISAIQVAIFWILGNSWGRFVFASPIPVLIASGVIMAYVFTNHFLNPLCVADDPLLSTTTVRVHSIFNRIHHNFSYHTEHHLAPGLNSKYYPIVSKILEERFPARYQCLEFRVAWGRLWGNPIYNADRPDLIQV